MSDVNSSSTESISPNLNQFLTFEISETSAKTILKALENASTQKGNVVFSIDVSDASDFYYSLRQSVVKWANSVRSDQQVEVMAPMDQLIAGLNRALPQNAEVAPNPQCIEVELDANTWAQFIIWADNFTLYEQAGVTMVKAAYEGEETQANNNPNLKSILFEIPETSAEFIKEELKSASPDPNTNLVGFKVNYQNVRPLLSSLTKSLFNVPGTVGVQLNSDEALKLKDGTVIETGGSRLTIDMGVLQDIVLCILKAVLPQTLVVNSTQLKETQQPSTEKKKD